MNDRPTVLVIDDRPDEVPLQEENPDIKLKIIGPRELNKDHLAPAHLVLVDYALGSWWPEESPFACRPIDGLAVMAVVGAHLRHLEHKTAPIPTALALISGALHEIAPADVVPHPHLLARAYGLDWVFNKQGKELNRQVGLLAHAVHELPPDWPDDPDEAETQLRQLLALDNKPGEDLAWSEVMRAAPPLHELSLATDGIAILRWLLQRVMPYPTFLWSTHRLATRFHVSHGWIREQLHRQSRLREFLAPACYDGVLADFMGERWWGAGIDSLVWDATDGASMSVTALREWIGEKAGAKPEPFADPYPVICLDEHYQRMDALMPMDDCVRIQLDDWPAHADAAWISIEIARENPRIASRVIETDRENLDLDGHDDKEIAL